MSGFITGLIITIHIVTCISLMAAILLQSGKGGGLAGTFGAGSSQTLFGGRGAATFLSRATTVLAVVFFVTSLTLGLQASRTAGTARRSLIQEEARRRGQQPAPNPSAGAPAQGGAVAPTGTSAPTTATPQAPTGSPNASPASAPVSVPGPSQSGGAPAPATGGK